MRLPLLDENRLDFDNPFEDVLFLLMKRFKFFLERALLIDQLLYVCELRSMILFGGSQLATRFIQASDCFGFGGSGGLNLRGELRLLFVLSLGVCRDLLTNRSQFRDARLLFTGDALCVGGSGGLNLRGELRLLFVLSLGVCRDLLTNRSQFRDARLLFTGDALCVG